MTSKTVLRPLAFKSLCLMSCFVTSDVAGFGAVVTALALCFTCQRDEDVERSSVRIVEVEDAVMDSPRTYKG